MTETKAQITAQIASLIQGGQFAAGRRLLLEKYPHYPIQTRHRSYTLAQKMAQFRKDGFIDRYSGKQLVHPGMLKVISHFYPDIFPYQSHWKMTATHIAYWELSPTIDHIHPIALGGPDDPDNWVTTSMMHNAIKSHWTLDQLQWSILPPGRLDDWDGLTQLFCQTVQTYPPLRRDDYILRWYRASGS